MDGMIKSIGEYVRQSLSLFGKEVNTKRQLPSVYDGLKPSYRHVIYEELKTGPQMRKTADIIGSCLSTTHAHGDASLQDPVSNLVRWGISEGQGNHGKRMLVGDDTPPSAMRYTEARISDKYYKIFGDLMPYVPYDPAEVKGEEPRYLPSVIPLCLVFGTMGLGLGVNCRIPAFTPASLIKSYFTNDPNDLEPNFGLIIDKNKSDLESLWNTGVGKICYKFRVSSGEVEGKYGYFIEGAPELFKPNLSQVNKLVNQSKAYIIDMTTKKSTKIFISREYNVKSLDWSELKSMINEAAVNTRTYRLTVTDGEKSYLIPMKEWIKFTVDNYISIVERFKEDKIQKLKYDYEVYENLPKVVNSLMKNRDYSPEDLSKDTNVRLSVVKSILSKSINTLRKSDSEEKLKKISDEIKKYESIVPIERVKSMVNEFEGA